MPPRRQPQREAPVGPPRERETEEEKRFRERVLKNYRTPGHPTAYSGITNVSKFYNISDEKAEKILQHDNTYQTHRYYMRPSIHNPYYIYGRRKLVQSDLIDIAKLHRTNDGIKYLAMFIDVFTKKAWAYPMKTKTGQEMGRVVREWLEEIGEPRPAVLGADAGREYQNAVVREIMRSNGIDLQIEHGVSKAAVCERLNKSIQILIFKYMTDTQSDRYIDKLPALMSTYNGRGHRSLEYMNPDEADLPENEVRVRGIHIARWNKIPQKKPIHKIDQWVRIKIDSKKIGETSRAYEKQFKPEYYQIVRINRLKIPLYHLKVVDDNDPVIGGFYKNEIVPCRGEVFFIEEVIRERGRGRNRQLFVKWLHFSDRWNSWIPANNVQRRFNRRGFAGGKVKSIKFPIYGPPGYIRRKTEKDASD